MRKALITWGGWEGHEPEQCKDIFAPWLKGKGFEVRIADTLNVYLDPKIMKDLDVIVPVWTKGEISREQSEALRSAIKSGVGLAGWHGGMCDSFRQDTEYQFMTGGQWVVHPGNADIRYTVDFTDNGQTDPITKDLKSG